jgi:hypothetical protein
MAICIATVPTPIAIAPISAVPAIPTAVAAIATPITPDMRHSGAVKAPAAVPATSEGASIRCHVEEDESQKSSGRDD